MSRQPLDVHTTLLVALRTGDRDLQGKVLQHYEPWLRLLARFQMETRLQRKFDPVDVVQQALLEALKSFASFRGHSEPELAAWLRGILARVLAHEVRRYHGAQKRDAGREIPLETVITAGLDDTSCRLGGIATDGVTPSARLIQREGEVALARALEHLSEEHRQVITLRHLEGLPHEAIAQRLGRSSGAVRMLWVRALAELRRALEADTTTP